MDIFRKILCSGILLFAPPLSGELYLDAAAVSCRKARYREAARFLGKSPVREGLRGLVILARVRMGLRDPAGALTVLRKALLIDPGDPAALGMAIRVRLALGKRGGLLPPLAALLAVAPARRHTHSLAARVYYRLGRYRQAQAHCRRALSMRVDGWECYRMGRITERLGARADALSWYRRAAGLGVRPRRGWLRIMAGCIWRGAMEFKRSGRVKTAAAWFRILGRQYPGTPYARAAGEQLAALVRLARWEKNRKRRKP